MRGLGRAIASRLILQLGLEAVRGEPLVQDHAASG